MRIFVMEKENNNSMHHPLQKNTIYNTNARHTAWRFAFYYFPRQILPELTKVNKVSAICLEPISCENMILLSVKPCCCNLHGWLTKWPLNSAAPFTYNPINLLPYYPFALLTYYHINSLTYNVLTIFQVISRGQ